MHVIWLRSSCSCSCAGIKGRRLLLQLFPHNYVKIYYWSYRWPSQVLFTYREARGSQSYHTWLFQKWPGAYHSQLLLAFRISFSYLYEDATSLSLWKCVFERADTRGILGFNELKDRLFVICLLLKITSLERVSVQKKECATLTDSHLGLYTNQDPQRNCIRTALGASPMGKSACHLGHFFAILKSTLPSVKKSP